MKLTINVHEGHFDILADGNTIDPEGYPLEGFPFEPDNGYVTPCFTYSFIWASDRTVVVCVNESDTEAVLYPGDSHECEHDAPMVDPPCT